MSEIGIILDQAMRTGDWRIPSWVAEEGGSEHSRVPDIDDDTWRTIANRAGTVIQGVTEQPPIAD